MSNSGPRERCPADYRWTNVINRALDTSFCLLIELHGIRVASGHQLLNINVWDALLSRHQRFGGDSPQQCRCRPFPCTFSTREYDPAGWFYFIETLKVAPNDFLTMEIWFYCDDFLFFLGLTHHNTHSHCNLFFIRLRVCSLCVLATFFFFFKQQTCRISEEVLDEGSDQFDPQLDVAVGPLERGVGHLRGAPVQPLLLLAGQNTGVLVSVVLHGPFIIVSGCGLERREEMTSRPPAAASGELRSPSLWRSGPPGHGEPSGNRS